jgi:hypothetical protein
MSKYACLMQCSYTHFNLNIEPLAVAAFPLFVPTVYGMLIQ